MLPFFKMQGCGNDFVVLDALSHPLPHNLQQAAIKLCDRHFGIGGDGLLSLEEPTSKGAAVRMRMWNPDGSEDMCGNGLRCIAALAALKKHVLERHFWVETLAGLREIEVLDAQTIRAGMGAPNFDFVAIPMKPLEGRENAIGYDLGVANAVLRGTVSLSTGSTHTILWEEGDFEQISPQIEHHAYFPERTSVMWARKSGENRLELRIWERGVGETLACGTGACAAAVAAIVTGRCAGVVEVKSRGGVLKVEWPQHGEIWLTGPGELVFEGVWTGAI